MTEAAFLSALAEVRPLLWRHAYRLTRPRVVSAEDLVQHALAVVWANRGKAADHPNPSGWLAQAGKWAMIRHAAGQTRHRTAELESHPAAFALSTTDPAPDEFDALVGLLSPAAGELVRRRFHDGCEFAELAADAGITTDGVRYRLNVALDHLRAALGG